MQGDDMSKKSENEKIDESKRSLFSRFAKSAAVASIYCGGGAVIGHVFNATESEKQENGLPRSLGAVPEDVASVMAKYEIKDAAKASSLIQDVKARFPLQMGLGALIGSATTDLRSAEKKNVAMDAAWSGLFANLATGALLTYPPSDKTKLLNKSHVMKTYDMSEKNAEKFVLDFQSDARLFAMITAAATAPVKDLFENHLSSPKNSDTEPS